MIFVSATRNSVKMSGKTLKLLVYGLALGGLVFLIGILPWISSLILIINIVVILSVSIIIGFKNMQRKMDSVLFTIGSFMTYFVLAFFKLYFYQPQQQSAVKDHIIIIGRHFSIFEIAYLSLIGALVTAIFSLIGSIIGLFIQRFFRPSLKTKKGYCMWCGSVMPHGAKICPNCGREPPSGVDVKVCSNCGAVIPKLAKFCSECGTAQP